MAKIEQIQEVALWKLKPYENNAKLHPQDQVMKIAQSIKEFGFLNPILIDKDYNIIAGHGRVEALKLLAWENAPCLFVEGLTDAQRKAYILADNKLTELGGWDFELVQEELKELEELDFNIDLTGFELGNKDYFEPIDDEGFGDTKQVEHSFSIDSKRYPITEEEFNLLNKTLDNYVDYNGVAYGFIREVINRAGKLY